MCGAQAPLTLNKIKTLALKLSFKVHHSHKAAFLYSFLQFYFKKILENFSVNFEF